MPVTPPSKPTQLTALGDHVWTLAVSGQGNRVVSDRTFMNRDIWRMELSPSGRQIGPPVRLIASSVPNGSPAYSPDGRKIAFGSARSGHNEMWICASDGSDSLQLTFLKRGQTGPPRWSPDGNRIFFDSNASGKSSIYVIDSDGRNLRRLTNGPADDALPSLSADGHSIYFTSRRSGRWEIWKMPVEGGEAVPVTSNGGWIAFESPDGRYLYYAKTAGVGSLRRRAAAGGPEETVAAPVLGNSLAASSRGICFARPAAPGGADVIGGGNVIELYSFRTGQIQTLATTPRPIYWFLSLSPDERFILYTETGQAGSDLMLLDNFR
jgi:Tol biopolymer transport system component